MGQRPLWERWWGAVLLFVCLLGQGERSVPARAQTTNSDEEIVYLDTAGFIRVLDPQATPGQNTVQWVSPVGGWRDFDLGDFNNDGDAEIVAVGGDSTSGRLTIYDPVVASGPINGDRVINGIPWAILYEMPLLGAPLLVSAGDLLPTLAGDEIAYVFALNPADRLDPDDLSRLVVLQPAAGVSDGSDWREEIDFVDFGNEWDRLSLGDLDNISGEEIILVDLSGFVRIYLVNGLTLAKIFDIESGSQPWQDGIAAQWAPGDLPELLLARSSSPGGATFWTFYYNPGDPTGFSDGHREFLLPPPRVLFVGDINNNDDAELFLLRTVPSNITNRARLFMRNAGTDTLPIFEHTLDADNGYLGGAAGDTDGDGRAEVVIIRNNNIRIYTQPESTPTLAVDNVLTALSDGRTIHVANLDRNGVVVTPQLTAAPTQLTPALSAGADPSTVTFTLTNPRSAFGPIDFNARVIGSPPWIAVDPSSGATPATLTVTFDPRNLAAGVYTATISIDSTNDQVLNLPLSIGVTATVRAGLTTSPAQLSYVAFPCAADSSPQQQSITLNGPSGQTFAAQINAASNSASSRAAPEPLAATTAGVEWPSAVDWVQASSPNVLPTTMLLTFSPAQVTALRSTAILQLIFYDAQSRQSRSLELSLFCATQQNFLPLIAR